MRIILIIFLLLTNTLTAQPKKPDEFILKGKVNNITDKFIYFISYNNNEERFIDSVKVINGVFEYKGKLNGYLNRFYVKLNPAIKKNSDSLNNLNLPIDNSIMNLELVIGQFSKYKLTGCISCDLLKKYNMKHKAVSDLSEKYQKVIEDSTVDRRIRVKYERKDSLNWKKLIDDTYKWCAENPSNSLTPYNLCAWADNFDSKKLKVYYNRINSVQKNSFFGNRLQKIIEKKQFQENQLEKKAFLFESIGDDSSITSLENISNNNYVLLDFWASWCKPCRASHPKLISLYKKYEVKNFKLIGVSVDEDILKWKEAIKNDSISLWSNILSKDIADKNPIDLGEKYFINEYPTKILIDDKGKIIGRYVGDDLAELEKKLKEIFKY